MTKEYFIELLTLGGKIVTKRCTERYLTKIGVLDWLNNNTPSDFETVSDKIKYQIYGGGYCDVCSVRTNVDASGRGFAKYCRLHFHQAKMGHTAHNNKTIDVEAAAAMYVNEQLSIVEISQKLGNISNVTLKKKLVRAGVQLRSHSDNQSIHSGTKGKPAHNRIVIDRHVLVEDYKNKMPVQALAEKHNCHPETIRRFLVQEGIDRFHRRSYIEWKIVTMLDDMQIRYETNKKNLIPNYDIDFFIPEYNVGIEVNGLYTHSHFTGKKPRLYHNDKFRLSQNAEVRLLQFWEHDVNERCHIISSMVANACNQITSKIDARSCDVRKISSATVREFCNNNHIQGMPSPAVQGLGLFVRDELVSVVAYTVKKDCTIIERFCSLVNTIVRGGFSKLLKQVPGNVIKTYSSNDISTGSIYQLHGFVCTKDYAADMWYTDYKTLLNRQMFMKSKLSTLLDSYDSCKTEADNMICHGYDVVYKSGTKTWVLTR